LFCFFSLPASVLGLAEFPFVLFAILAGLGYFALNGNVGIFWRNLFCWAAFLGTIGEILCVCVPWTADSLGLWKYTFPDAEKWGLQLPMWLPIVWGDLHILYAGISLLIIYPTEHNIQPPSFLNTRISEILRFFAIMAVCSYGCYCWRYVHPVLLFPLTMGVTAFNSHWNTWHDILLYCIAGSIGSFGEILCMKRGLWIYSMPFFVESNIELFGTNIWLPGIPLTLFMAWGLSATGLWHLSKWAKSPLLLLAESFFEYLKAQKTSKQVKI